VQLLQKVEDTPKAEEEHAPKVLLPPKAEACSNASSNCWDTKCCKDDGLACFAQDLGWAQCNASCAEGAVWSSADPNYVQTKWSCALVVTHLSEGVAGRQLDVPVKSAAPAQPRDAQCAAEGEYCGRRPCCEGSGTKCFKKNAMWASCRKECTPGIDKYDPKWARTPWSCEELAPATDSVKEETLFCFALMLPDSYEVGLIQTQLDARAGIFGCDAAAVYSNQSIKVSSEVSKVSLKTQIVPGSLHCELGGEYWTALNTEIFVRVWKKVVSGKAFAAHGWTVKADPDAVIIPRRLRLRAGRSRFLSGRKDKVYMNNCQFGLHGPVEMMSLGAMAAYRDGIDRCVEDLRDEFSQYGEDVFLRECLQLLGVDKVEDFSMMKETHCDWYGEVDQEVLPCDKGRAAYHPLKTEEDWTKCFKQAMDEEPEETTTAPATETTIPTTPTTPTSTTTLTETAATRTGVSTLPPADEQAKEVPGLISAVLKVRESCAHYGGVLHQDNVSCCPAACGDHCGAPDCQKWGPGCCGSSIPVMPCNDSHKAPCTLISALVDTESNAPAKSHEAEAPVTTTTAAEAADAQNLSWLCHQYEGDQDVEWCKNAPADDHFEYKFFGPDSPCEYCWCCKRTLPTTDASTGGSVSATAAADEGNSTTASSSFPFNCDVGFEHWKDGWSAAKKSWCCEHMQVGCEASSTTSALQEERGRDHKAAVVEAPTTWRDMWTGLVWDTAPPDEAGDTHYAAQFTATGDDVSGTVTIVSEGGFGGNGTYHYNSISVNGMIGRWIQDGAQTKLAWSSMFTWTRDTAVETLPHEESAVKGAISEVVIATTREPAAANASTTAKATTTASPAPTTTTEAKWACHTYVGIIGRANCEKETADGMEYKFFGAANPCRCWCCKRPAGGNATAATPTTTATTTISVSTTTSVSETTVSVSTTTTVSNTTVSVSTTTTVSDTTVSTLTVTSVTTPRPIMTTLVSVTTRQEPSSPGASKQNCSMYDGITHFNSVTCCHRDCGDHCGATDCGDYGKDQCCAGSIPNQQACSDTQKAPCTMLFVLDAVRVEPPAALPSTTSQESPAEEQGPEWECVYYDWEQGGQCPDGVIADGYEYRFFGEDTPCPPCWCCKSRQDGEAAPAPKKKKKKQDEEPTTGPEWECVSYDWEAGGACPEGVLDGYEYQYFGEDTPCSPCWCCKSRQDGEETCVDLTGHYEYSGRKTGTDSLTQSGCQGLSDVGWSYTVNGGTVTMNATDATGSISGSPGAYTIDWSSGYVYTMQAPPAEEEEEEAADGTSTPAVPTSNACEQYGGIAHFDQVTCCAQSCGEFCGATNCAWYGEQLCCAGKVPADQVCGPDQQAPCTLASAPKAEERGA
jgi:hypothetical protein